MNCEFRLAILVTAIKAAKGVDTFKGNSTFTVFVPTDQTFPEL
ncbi:fasciclin domain-containing protein [Nostoc sp.]